MDEEEFRYRIYEEWYFLQPGKTIAPNARVRDSIEKERHTPHFFYSYPFCGVLDVGDDGVDWRSIKIGRAPSHQHLEMEKRRWLMQGYRLVDFDDDNSLGIPVCNSKGDWSFQGTMCRWCGKPFPAELTARQQGKRHFCSDACKEKFRNFERQYSVLRRRGEITDSFHLLHESGMPGIEMVKYLSHRPCENCGKLIGDTKPLSAKFCSDKCRYAYHNKKKREAKK